MGRDETRAAILDAATAILREDGARAMTTRAVAERAGVQAPTIYRLFGDKGGLAEAVAAAAMEAYVATKEAPAETAPSPVDALRAAWRRHIDFGLAHPELYELISRPGIREHAPATARGIEILAGLVRAIAAAGLLVVGERRAIEMLHTAGNGAVLTLLGQRPEDRDPGLPDAMLDAVLAAVTGQGPAAGSPEPADLGRLTPAERALLAEWLSRS